MNFIPDPEFFIKALPSHESTNDKFREVVRIEEIEVSRTASPLTMDHWEQKIDAPVRHLLSGHGTSAIPSRLKLVISTDTSGSPDSYRDALISEGFRITYSQSDRSSIDYVVLCPQNFGDAIRHAAQLQFVQRIRQPETASAL